MFGFKEVLLILPYDGARRCRGNYHLVAVAGEMEGRTMLSMSHSADMFPLSMTSPVLTGWCHSVSACSWPVWCLPCLSVMLPQVEYTNTEMVLTGWCHSVSVCSWPV